MKFVIATALFALASATDSWNQEFDLVDLARVDLNAVWHDWKASFGRQYPSIEEEFARFEVFLSNIQKMAQFNSADETSKVSPNQFADMTREEYLDYVHAGGYKSQSAAASILGRFKLGQGRRHEKSDAVNANPTSVDWTTQGVVTPVKNQGQCGSCWSFSATGATECRVAIATGTLTSLSEQQLVDCSRAEGNLGCSGGEMDAAFKYIEKNGGLCTEKEYPYTARNGQCESSTCGTFYDDISGYTDVTVDSEPALETAVAAGCVSVAIEADQFAFQYYSSGILTGTCGTNLDHGVLAVGYGVEGSQDYWKVKNSWGTSWGEQGYVRICKSCDKNHGKGECGILMDPSFPISK